MRRRSDIEDGNRSGAGRRARDHLLSGEEVPAPPALAGGGGTSLAHLRLFLGDELRESALAMAGIEAFLVRAQDALSRPDLTGTEIDRLIAGAGLDDRLQRLDDSLAALRRSLRRLQDRLS